MPVNAKMSRGAIIQELLHSKKSGGSFAKGKSAGKARQMAVAAAFNIKGQGRKS